MITRRTLEATLAQLMKGVLFPNSNVIFFAQSQNPADVPPAKDPSTATDPLANTCGKWEAVENSGLALAECGICRRFGAASVRMVCLFQSAMRIGQFRMPPTR
jgi:hypothetical protein